MMIRLASVTLVACATLAGCGGSDSHFLGSLTVGPYTVDVSREQDAPIAGAMTDFVVKPTSGGTPDSVKGWVGTATRMDSTVVTGVFDSNDGDYDHDLTMPTPVAADAEWVFVMTTGGSDAMGEIAFQGSNDD